MSTLVRWEPFRELGTLQSELSRLMNGMLEGNGRQSQNWVPALDVWETPTEVVYAFDLPGIPEEQINIEVKDETGAFKDRLAALKMIADLVLAQIRIRKETQPQEDTESAEFYMEQYRALKERVDQLAERRRAL